MADTGLSFGKECFENCPRMVGDEEYEEVIHIYQNKGLILAFEKLSRLFYPFTSASHIFR